MRCAQHGGGRRPGQRTHHASVPVDGWEAGPALAADWEDLPLDLSGLMVGALPLHEALHVLLDLQASMSVPRPHLVSGHPA